ncbi:MAG: hypothetical protein ACM34K_02235 [Bacillota bacterium]
MENIAIIYFEGNDSKVTVFEMDKDSLKLIKAESISSSQAFTEKPVQPGILVVNSQLEMVNYEAISDESAVNNSYVQSLSRCFEGIDMKTLKVIPVLTEPAVYFRHLQDEKDLSTLKVPGNGKVKAQPVGLVDMAGGSKLAVSASGKSNYLQALDQLAKINNMKFLKIISVKSAEVSLADFAAEKEKLQDNETSLVIYIGKEYSKPIFMKGRKILHIGSTVSAGKNSSNPYYVIISKILLEMENASIHMLNRIIICGEDSSDNLFSALEQAYPESKISQLKIPEYVIPGSNVFGYKTSAYSVNIAAAEEYVKELKKEKKGINLLPGYIIEEQRSLGWESYLFIFLIFAVVFGFTTLVLHNRSELAKMSTETAILEQVQQENQTVSDRITQQKEKISNYSKSKVILDTYSQNTGTLSAALRKISEYAQANENIWFTKLTLDRSRALKLSGYALGRNVLTRLSYSYSDALLSGIIYEPLREYKAYKFDINTSLNNAGVKK